MKKILLPVLCLMGLLLACGSESESDEVEAYDGPVTEIAFRRLNAGQDVVEFGEARDAYVDLLKGQPKVGTDREFVAFLDFQTGAAPEPPVYIGMTQYENLSAFENAVEALAEDSATAEFIGTFNPETFSVLRPLEADTQYEIGEILTEQGHILEIVVRDLSSYEDFDFEAYDQARVAFLDALRQQNGFIAEYQWVSVLDPNIVVGMTVYESVDAYFALYGGEFGQSEVTQTFGGNYPVLIGYGNFDARQPQ